MVNSVTLCMLNIRPDVEGCSAHDGGLIDFWLLSICKVVCGSYGHDCKTIRYDGARDDVGPGAWDRAVCPDASAVEGHASDCSVSNLDWTRWVSRGCLYHPPRRLGRRFVAW